MPLIRYPGSKAKLVGRIREHIPHHMTRRLWSKPATYCEPFFGSGAIGFNLMKDGLHPSSRVILNDLDPGIAALWGVVKHSPRELCRRIVNFVPTVDAFYDLKSRDGEHGDDVDVGFRKLALHRLSLSGFGYMAGGPIGGRHQSSEYNVNCRWNANRLTRDIAALSQLLNKFDAEITNEDFESVLGRVGDNSLAYIDPPYYEKGSQLYKFSMSDADHERLAATVNRADFDWLVSYDDHPFIRNLYTECECHVLHVSYSNAVTFEPVRPKNREILLARVRSDSHV